MNPLQVIKDATDDDLVKVTLRGPASLEEIEDVRDQLVELNPRPFYEIDGGGSEFVAQVMPRG